MSFDGNGNWSSPFYPVQDRDNGIAILASKFQTLIQENLKESFENCITRDGAGKPTTNINWNGNKITNLQNGTSSADAVNKSQLDAVSTAKVSKSGDTMTGDLTISKSDASLKLINDNSDEYDIVSNDNGNLELVPAAGSGKKVYLNATDNYEPYYTDGTYHYKLINEHDITFNEVNATIAQGGTEIADTYSLSSYLTDGKDHQCLFSVDLNMGANGGAKVALASDLLTNASLVCGTNNGFGTGGSVVIPCNSSVTVSFPAGAGYPNATVKFLGYW